MFLITQIWKTSKKVAETNGAFAVIDMLIPPDGGPGPHEHAQIEESFYVIDGEIEVKSEFGEYIAKKGSFVNIPKGGIVHWSSIKFNNSIMKILMTGATGRFAGLVLPQLKKQGHHVTALVQDGNKGKQTIASGADQFAIGDLYNPVTLKNAAAGAEGVFHIIPAFNREVEAGLNMVKAALEAGVTKFVFSSVYHTSLSLANHAEKRPAEEALYRSGMDYTILQPAMYMQMLQQSWQAAKQSGEIIMPYSKNSKMAYVDYRDVAEAAALAITDKRLSYGTFELASPGMFSRVDLAGLMGKKLNKTIIPKDLPVDEWAKQVKIPPGELCEGLIAMNKEYDQYGFSGGNSLVLDTILGRPAHTVPQFIEELK